MSQIKSHWLSLAAAMIAITFSALTPVFAQHHEPSASSVPPASPPPAAAAAQGKHIGDPYPLDTCPITGKKLGSMGDPVTKLYDGREIRFCCPACPAKFEKDLKASMAALDEKIVKDQAPLYPLTTSVISGKALGDHPVQFVYGNRLVRVADEAEKSEFMKDPKTHFNVLNKAVIAAQGKGYPISKCPVSGEAFGGEMGDPIDVVVAGRLIRLCCGDCRKNVESDPAKFIAMVDAARKGATGSSTTKPDAGRKDDHHEQQHGGG